jgi:hypothetical protein
MVLWLTSDQRWDWAAMKFGGSGIGGPGGRVREEVVRWGGCAAAVGVGAGGGWYAGPSPS